MSYSKKDITTALRIPDFDGREAQLIMSPSERRHFRPSEWEGEARLGGVLLLLYCYNDEPHLVLTRRRDDLQYHAGQVSFPGGGHEDGETLQNTALREAYEEIGIEPDSITVVGQLTTLYITPSDYEVYPFVAYYTDNAKPPFIPNDREVDEILEVPLSILMNPATVMTETWTRKGYSFDVPYFALNGHKVWGATAMMLSEFIERLRKLDTD